MPLSHGGGGIDSVVTGDAVDTGWRRDNGRAAVLKRFGMLRTESRAAVGERSRAVRARARHVLLGSNGPRRYLAPELTLDEFFEILKQRDIRYVILRWFESLPHVDPGEDIDILVADEHLEFLHTLLVPWPARRDSQKFDLYTVSGLPGSDFGGIPYYPPRIARVVLGNAVWLNDRYRVPSPEHHFSLLAYHAAYHKGYASGLRAGTSTDEFRQASDHDYEAVLTELARRLGISVEPTLHGLDAYLAEKGLRPPLDSLARLEARNPWIRDRFFDEQPEIDPLWQGLAVFVVRERAEGLVDLAAEELDRCGFEILEVVRLDPVQRDAASDRLRGGNWERGPWPLSGGRPSSYIIVYDVAPQLAVPDGGWEMNLRIPAAKGKVRDRLLRGVDGSEHYNAVHSSDNPRQALDYLEVLAAPALEARLRTTVRELLDACTAPFPVVRYLAPAGAGRRARVSLVDHPVHGLSVCKVFRPGAARFFERELRARTELSDLPEVPGLLEHGDNWLLTPLYRDDRRHVLRRLPFMRNTVQLRSDASRAMARFARTLHERGLFMLDLSPQNLMSDPEAGLKVLDLEFLQAYGEQAPDLAGSYTFQGVPRDVRDSYDEPRGVPLTTTRVGNSVFHPAVTGLPHRDLLRPGGPAVAVRRSATQLAWYAYLLIAGPYTVGRSRLAGSRRVRKFRTAYALVQARRRGRR